MISEKELVCHHTIYHTQSLSSNLDYLQKCDSITFDFSNATNLEDKHLQIVAETLSKLTTLKSLSVDLRNCNRVTDSGISKLSTAISELSSLEVLRLNLEGCPEITSHGVSSLEQPQSKNFCVATRDRQTVISGAISGPDSLKILSLNFKGNEKIDDAGFTGLAHAIAAQTKITKLSLDFSDCTNLTNVGAIEIFKTLPLLTEIECLTILIDGPMEVTEDGLTVLNESIAQLTHLFSLKLGISRNRYVNNSLLSEEGDESGLFGLFACLVKREKLHEYGLGKALSRIAIKELELNCFNEHITDTGVIKLSHSLSKVESLRKIKINFANPWRVRDDSIREYINTICQISSLTQFGIDFSTREGVGDKEGTLIAQKLEELGKIKSLILNFHYCTAMTSETLLALSKSLLKLKEIKEFYLDLQGTKITSVGLDQLTKSLNTCANLTDLKLNLSYTQITDFSVRSFIQMLEYLSNLDSLQLNFRYCQLSDSGLSYLGAAIKKLTKLKILKLELDNNTGISDDLFAELGVSISDLPDIREVGIYAAGSSVSDKGLKKLTNDFKSLKYLTHFVLSLEKCTKITEAGLENLGENMKEVQALAKLSLNIEGCREITSIEKCLGFFIGHKSLAQFEVKVNSEWKVDSIDTWNKKLEDSGLLRGNIGSVLLNK